MIYLPTSDVSGATVLKLILLFFEAKYCTCQCCWLYPAAVSGTTITSNRKIAVVSGNANRRMSNFIALRSHLVEQLAAVKYWGQEYIVVSQMGQPDQNL